MHHIGNEPNPYEQAISIIGRTLSKFDEDNLIPCFGFGDGTSFYKLKFHFSFIIQYFSALIILLHKDLIFLCGSSFAASTHDQEVFSFFSDERFCNGFEEVMSRYRELVPQLRLAGAASSQLLILIAFIDDFYLINVSPFFFIFTGPTSFAPIIEMAITIVEQSGGQYHVLLIIADGQVKCIFLVTKYGHFLS